MVENLFELAPYAMMLVDQAGHIVHVNAQLETLFGYPRQELQAKLVELLLPACLQSWYADPAALPLNSSLPGFQVELQGRHKDMREFPVEIRLAVLPPGVVLAEDAMTNARSLFAIFDLVTHKPRMAKSAEVHHRLHDRHVAENMALGKRLHNEPLQELQTLNFVLAALADTFRTATEEPPSTVTMAAMLADVVQIRENIGRVSKQLRLLHHELYPLALMSFGLTTALQAYIKSLQFSYPTLHIELNLSADDLELPTPVSLALYHVCQQALKNIEQHAHAHHVTLQLQAQPEQITLEIIDDGCGFDVPLDWITIIRQGRLGLSSAQERIEAIGGHLSICSAPAKGTTIRVIAPIKSTDPI